MGSKARICIFIHIKLCDAIYRQYLRRPGFSNMAWLSYRTPHKTTDAITYSGHVKQMSGFQEIFIIGPSSYKENGEHFENVVQPFGCGIFFYIFRIHFASNITEPRWMDFHEIFRICQTLQIKPVNWYLKCISFHLSLTTILDVHLQRLYTVGISLSQYVHTPDNIFQKTRWTFVAINSWVHAWS